MAAPIPITPVILSGGAGTRLWPVSRAGHPKQFLALVGDTSLFGLTLARIDGLAAVRPPVIVANAAHADLVRAQGRDDMTLILEPCARNTAPAIALAALALGDDAGAMLVMPSDHIITDVPAFHAAIARALPLAAQGWLVTFGIEPDQPHTGYGYIALSAEITPGVQQVARFVEKPDEARARAMLEQGGHVWNAGIFLFSPRAYLDALARHQPDMLTATRAAMAQATRMGNVLGPAADAFAQAPSNSIDYAVMERAGKVACVPVSMGWSDVGSFDSLYELADRDKEGNAVHGPARLIDARNCLTHSDGPTVNLVGVEDLIVIATADEVLVLPRGHSQAVRQVAALAAKEADQAP